MPPQATSDGVTGWVFSNMGNLVTASDQPLYYYWPYYGFAQTPTNWENLLTTYDGNCFAWAELFEQCLYLHGIYDWEQEYVSVSRSNQADDNYMCVYNWEPVRMTLPATNTYPYYVYFGTVESLPEMVYGANPYGDWKSNPGLPGENTSTPSEKVFGNHQIVKCFWSDGAHSYIDPSYWDTYTGPNGFETTAVFGFGKTFNHYGMYARTKSGNGVNDIAFWPDTP